MIKPHWKEKAIRLTLLAAASTSILIVALIFIFLGKEAVPFAEDPGLSNLASADWVPVSFQEEQFGLLPLITGSLLVTLMATIFTVPVGIGAAIYLAEIATPKERAILKPIIELLAGIPSVVLGFFGLIVLAPIVKAVFGLPTGLNAMTGSLLLALMAIPTVVSISEDAIQSVPEAYKSASLALGATRLQTLFRVTVPAAMSGIIAAVMLAMGRIVGETMAVMMVTGNAAKVTLDPTDSVRTMTATIAAEMGEVPVGSVHYHALFCVGVVLLLVTFLLNMVAQRALRGYQN